jgi:S-adenosyl-L-methionine hydrolase (adenosine-forming)
MNNPVITLTTDFGEDSPYVAAMKGVILGTNPRARIMDLSHQIPPQDVRHAAFFLAGAVPYFPADVLHVVVVDPGVGSERAVLYVELGRSGHRLLVPDNGCWTWLPNAESAAQIGPTGARAIRVTEPRYWRTPVSATFHGRDIFAPVAAHLSLGISPAAFGTPVGEWVILDRPAYHQGPDRLAGEVLFVDHYGNLITNIPGGALVGFPPEQTRTLIGDQEVPRRVRTYAEAEPGALVALVSSRGTLEIAVTNGNAAGQLGVGVGTPVVVQRREAEAGT